MIDFDPHDLRGRPLHEIPHKVIYLCPKYLNAETPAPYQEWLRAIQDTLDEEVDEGQYHRAEIQKLFDAIRREQISPDERARMIDESHQEELQTTKFEDGKLAGRRETAQALLRKGIPVEIIAETTGLSLEEITAL